MSSSRYPKEFTIEAVKRGFPVADVAGRQSISMHSPYTDSPYVESRVF